MARAHFDTGAAALHSEDKAALDRVATCLKENRGMKVSIDGNADERGSEALNAELADKRANAVESYLESQGVAASQLGTVSYGRDNPLCTTHNEQCWSANRRTTIRTESAHK